MDSHSLLPVSITVLTTRSPRVFRIAQFIKENTENALKLEIIVQTVMLFVSVGERDLEFGFMKTSETLFSRQASSA